MFKGRNRQMLLMWYQIELKPLLGEHVPDSFSKYMLRWVNNKHNILERFEFCENIIFMPYAW